MANTMSAAQRATAARSVARLDAGGRVAHKRKGTSYASGANREYIRDQARKRGVVGVDLDTNPNAQLHPWIHHNLHPTKHDGWFDPTRHVTDRDNCRELVDREMSRLRVRYQGRNRPMLTALQGARFCRDVRGGPLIPCFEAKFLHGCYTDPQWWFEQFVEHWEPSLQPVIMTLPGTNNGQSGLAKLAAAHEVGLPTMWLWRGDQAITHTPAFRQHVDLVKSRPHHGIYRV